jgi:pimeloyl-ACP methyl ester carboxylesterase
MARRGAITAATAGAALIGSYTCVRWLARRVREDAKTHAVTPELLPATRQHTVRGPNDTLLAVWDTPAARDDVPQIVFVHGWMGTHHVWDWVVRALAGNAHLVTFDLPFHGQSGAPQPEGIDLDFFGDALVSVIDDVLPRGPIVLVGHSLGGMVLLNALRRYPTKLSPRLASSVLVSTAASFADSPTALVTVARPLIGTVHTVMKQRVVNLIGRAVAAVVARDTDLLWLFAVKVQGRMPQPAVTYGIVQAARAAHPEALRTLAPAVVTLHERDGLAVAATRPMCVIAGSDDWLTPRAVTATLAAAAGAEMVMCDAVGHVAPKEAADQVAAVIGRYVGVRPKPSGMV